MKREITKEQAREAIASIILSSGVGRATDNAKDFLGGGYVNLTFTSGVWADEATVEISEQHGEVIREQGETVGATAEYRVQVGWSSTHRSVSSALVACKNYARAIEFASLVQATAENFPTVVLYRKDKEA